MFFLNATSPINGDEHQFRKMELWGETEQLCFAAEEKQLHVKDVLVWDINL